jgi:hypothetical protein
MSSKRIVRGLLAALVVATAGGCAVPGLKAYWDFEIDRLCEQDGGVTIYETVPVARSDFLAGIEGGVVPVYWPSRQPGKGEPHLLIGDPRKHPKLVVYRGQEIRKDLHDWNPQVWRSETPYVRASDNKVVAKLVTYFRVGGDFLWQAHPTGTHCPRSPSIGGELAKMFVAK